MKPVVAFLPGNGHVDARLDFARDEARRRGLAFELRSVDYGAAPSFDALLDSVAAAVQGADLVYATGIGGLVALALRGRGDAFGQRTILQGPVLWGLETRTFPKVMRLPLMPRALTFALSLGAVQRRFERKHFTRPLEPAFKRAFFGGYRDARAFERWFRWLTPELLRRLEGELRGRPERLAGVACWWGAQDHVVGLDELARTEAALGLQIPVTEFPAWGHYPMIDEPGAWAEEVARALASAE